MTILAAPHPTPPPRRSLLFVPGHRPERIAKALAAGADMVCVDLEDAVPADDKAAARAHGLRLLAEASQAPALPERVLRLNALSTRAGLEDLLALLQLRPQGPGLVFLPKVDSAAELRLADRLLSEAGLALGLMVLIETAEALEQVAEIAAATPRLQAVTLGAVDLAADLGADLAAQPLLYARSRLVHAARRAGVDVLDAPTIAFQDAAVVAAEAQAARALGFTGKMAIHPAAVRAIHDAFTPDADAIAWAARVVSAQAASGGGVAMLQGRFIEPPVARAQARILAIARAAGLEIPPIG